MADELQLWGDGSAGLVVVDEPTPKLTIDPECCCNPSVGFACGSWPHILACGTWPWISLLASSNSHRLSECGNVFAGSPRSVCGSYCNFPEAMWPTVKTWVENGGRLWVSGEFGTAGPVNTGGVDCLGAANRTALNAFMAALGVPMSITNTAFDANGCVTTSNITAGHPITAGLTEIGYGLSAGIAGGIKLIGSKTSNTSILAIEPLGDGYVILEGDSDLFGNCAQPGDCEFIRRWVEETAIITP